MTGTEPNIHALDAAYKPFPTFAEWSSQTSVDTARWNRYVAEINGKAKASPDALARARDIVKRATALDTGAIEGLYEVDHGFTFSVAFETAAWETQLASKGENVRPLFEAQLHAYDYVLDLATEAEQITEAAIRKLHEVVCAAQNTYRVVTAVGFQEQSLPKGRYKVLPNHVIHGREGTTHSYAPVDVTPIEMARLMNEIRSEGFQSAHPVMQAAYAHYAFVVIHPFADGNGRVARALASAFTYRAISMPIMILSEHKEIYLNALKAADSGSYQPFVDFILARSLDTLTLVGDNLRKASVPSAEESLAAINGLSGPKGIYSEEELDSGGIRLLRALLDDLKGEISKVTIYKIQGRAELSPGARSNGPAGHRAAQSFNQHLHVELLSIQPSRVPTRSFPPAVVARGYDLYVPRDFRGKGEYLIRERSGKDDISVPVEDAIPNFSGILQLRIPLFGERIVAEMLVDLRSEIDRVNDRRLEFHLTLSADRKITLSARPAGL